MALYGRISAAKDDQQVSTTQQRREMLPTAEALANGARIEEYVDESISGWSGALRPEFERLLVDMAAGRVRTVVTWNVNRIARQPADWYRFEAVAIKLCIPVRTKNAEYDFRSPQSRLTAGFEALLARAESDNKSEAVLRGLRRNAELGRWHGRVAFGYRRVWERSSKGRPVSVAEEVEPTEAAVVREIAHRIVSGDSMRRIVADLNARGVRSPGPTTSKVLRAADQDDRHWTPVKARAVVSRERNVGKRIHQSTVIGDGQWPAILDERTWEQVRAILGDRARRTSTSSAAVHMLSGIARCGVCGATVRGATNRGVPSYKCSATSCVSRNRRDVDDLVTAIVVGRLQRPDASSLFAADRRRELTVALEEHAALRARLDLAADGYAAGDIDSQQLARINAKLRPQLEAAQARARTVDDSPLIAGLVGQPETGQVWAELPLPHRRAAVALLIDVTILRARQGARVFDPSSIRIAWKA